VEDSPKRVNNPWTPAQDEGSLVAHGRLFFAKKGWDPFPFQLEAWSHFEQNGDALVNAPTGSGKTYSVLVPAVLGGGDSGGLRVLWITPIRALAKEIQGSASRLLAFQNRGWWLGCNGGG
jgi:ATP-dependent Lhr-like helicase